MSFICRDGQSRSDGLMQTMKLMSSEIWSQVAATAASRICSFGVTLTRREEINQSGNNCIHIVRNTEQHVICSHLAIRSTLLSHVALKDKDELSTIYIAMTPEHQAPIISYNWQNIASFSKCSPCAKDIHICILFNLCVHIDPTHHPHVQARLFLTDPPSGWTRQGGRLKWMIA